MKELHEKLHDLREEHNLTQKQVALHLGVKQQTYFNYEKGRHEIPTWVVISLAKYYKVSLDYLFGTDATYLGSINLQNPYVDDITMDEVVYKIHKLRYPGRQDLMKHIDYLTYVQKMNEQEH